MTATKAKPATPLPWITDNGTVIYSSERGAHRGAVAEYGYQQDAAYIVAACNAYPHLVASLDAMNKTAARLEADRAKASAEATRLLAERAELIAALREVYEIEEGPGATDRPHWAKVRALLSRIGGGNE